MNEPRCPVLSDFRLSDYEIVVLMTHMLKARARTGIQPGMEDTCRLAEEKAIHAARSIRDPCQRRKLEREIADFHQQTRGTPLN